MNIKLNIDKGLIEQLETNRDKIRDQVRQVVREKADELRAKLWEGSAEVSAAYHALDWMDYMETREPRRHIRRIVTEHPPYMGGGIITTLHAGRKRT